MDQTITISDSTKTYINPLDLDQNYSLSEDGGDSPVKAKVEYMQGWVESIIDEGSLSPIEKTIVDRCVRHIFEDYEKSGFTDESKQPLLKDFQEELNVQPEEEAKKMAKALSVSLKVHRIFSLILPMLIFITELYRLIFLNFLLLFKQQDI